MFPGSLQYEFQVQFNRLDYMPPNYHAFMFMYYPAQSLE